jgi:hypothetical protein
VGRQDRELHSRVGENLERLVVHRGLGQPHALGVAFKPLLKIPAPPPDLRDLVTPRGEREDHVIVDLGDGVPVAAVGLDAATVGFEDASIDLGRMAIEPRE